ncbi:MAG: HD domain-containing protein [Chloroflexota bacterium]|nr:HD domain-containing protein [Chloroflexota bacterium]
MQTVEQKYAELQELLYYLTLAERSAVRRAFEFAREMHCHQTRKSGELYIFHPLIVAQTLARLKMDSSTICAGLLHDVIEDTLVTYEEMESKFGSEIAQLVAGVTKLGENVKELRTLQYTFDGELTYEQKNLASLVNLFLAMASDLRVIIIKLADRLHNLNTLQWVPPHKQVQKAREAFDLFVPIAARLGIHQLQVELADPALEILVPETYAEIQQILTARPLLLKRSLEDSITQISHHLGNAELHANIAPLPESVLTLYKYIQAHGLENARTYHPLRIRITVETRAQCYAALGNLHELFTPLTGQLLDYIAAPRGGFYRALQTSVIGLRGRPTELHISTPRMQHLAKYGVIAYLQHPSAGATLNLSTLSLPWLTDLTQLPHDDPEIFLHRFKSELAPERIRVFTPKGDVIELPQEATPLDFAYAVHTEIGHRCRRALVNGEYAALNSTLHNGDQVEILKSLRIAIQRAWLDEDLNYTRQAATQRRIRRWFSHRPKADQIEMGYQLIEEEMLLWGECVGWSASDILYLAQQRSFSIDDFCMRVGRGEITQKELGNFIFQQILNKQPAIHSQQVILQIQATDRSQLLRDVTQIVARNGLNMRQACAVVSEETSLAKVQIKLDVTTIADIVRVTHQIKHILSVLKIWRVQTAESLLNFGMVQNPRELD